MRIENRVKESGIRERCRLHFYVYVLKGVDVLPARTYVGWTTDIDRRIDRHNKGLGAKSTRGRNWALVYAERFATRHDAMSREWHLKRDRAFRANFR